MTSLAFSPKVAFVLRVVRSTPPIWEVSISSTAPACKWHSVTGSMERMPSPLPVPTCFSMYFTRAPSSRKNRWMPLCRAGSPFSVWTPHPATMVTSAQAPT